MHPVWFVGWLVGFSNSVLELLCWTLSLPQTQFCLWMPIKIGILSGEDDKKLFCHFDSIPINPVAPVWEYNLAMNSLSIAFAPLLEI